MMDQGAYFRSIIRALTPTWWSDRERLDDNKKELDNKKAQAEAAIEALRMELKVMSSADPK